MDNKYFTSEIIEVKRSQIHPAVYNPRKISKEGKAALKRSIKNFGVLGGIVINRRTNNTIISGHQKVDILDILNDYPEKDYALRVEVVDYDEKKEKEANCALNSPNVGGEYDYDKLRELIPDIDYKDAGLTEQDLDIIGVDFNFQTEEENIIADELDTLMEPVREERQAEVAQKQAERAEKVAHMKQVKEEVKQAATKAAADMDAYLMLSFDNWEAKENFLKRFGYPEGSKFIKGELFDLKCERVYDE